MSSASRSSKSGSPPKGLPPLKWGERVEFQSKKGVFMSRHEYQDLVDALENATEQEPVNTKHTVELAEKLQAVREEHETLINAFNKCREEAIRLGKELGTARAANAAAAKAHEQQGVSYKKQLHEKHLALAELSDRLDKVNKAKAADGAKFDAELAVNLAGDEATAKAERHALEQEISALRVSNSASLAKVTESSSRLKAVEAELKAYQAEIFQLRKKDHADDWLDIQDIYFQNADTTVHALLGTAGVSALLMADKLGKDAARERLYQLRGALWKSKNPKLIGLKDVLTIVWNWLKTAKIKQIHIILPWLRMVFADLWAGTIHASQFYIDVLQAQFDNAKLKYKLALEDAKKKHPEQKGWFSWLQSQANATFKGVSGFFSRAKANSTASLMGIKSAIRATFNAFFNSFTKVAKARYSGSYANKGKSPEKPDNFIDLNDLEEFPTL